MLKYTSVEHQDHKLLKLALQDIHELAVNINNIEKETEQVEKDIKKLREIETCIEGTVEVSLMFTLNSLTLDSLVESESKMKACFKRPLVTSNLTL